ncbi:hypothetical protein HMPREF9444_00982 [Succinatimonas hippei YIT 12066]|uniref:Uncharacterized protein n=1 Tax=Succinatimonas hippei (strain DSM 22608 / JCM 16073 / KCTC 15190 / YIT 12066) TaxID=762983 RepID=E8LJU6_SUCHY|nr:hypothetical protein HMPREF9444_00982 [Succinatimonas hippei YIT 12066]
MPATAPPANAMHKRDDQKNPRMMRKITAYLYSFFSNAVYFTKKTKGKY